MKKYYNESWNFNGFNTKTYTNCFHNYPAMMIPQVAERILSLYGKKAKLLFDPYCGTGTSLLEANLKKINAIGTDLNPLARLIAIAKTTKLNLQILDLYLKEYSEFTFQLLFDFRKTNIVVPQINNIDFWFDKSIQEKLAIIKNFINNISDNSVMNFFKVAFSETVRECSWTRNSEFKMFRITEEQMKKFNPDVFGIMQNKLARNHKGLVSFIETDTGYAYTKVYDFNTVEKVEHIENESVDIIVTSPPYGDSHTTVAYGQFSRLPNEWLDIYYANQIDKKLMGGKLSQYIIKFNYSKLDETIENIANIDCKRAKEVSSFYRDYEKSISNVSKTIGRNGFACYVVGNRKVKGLTLPTDETTKHFFEKENFKHIETIIRDIPNKRMPSKNSPSNVVGEQDSTMCNEYIVIMQKN